MKNYITAIVLLLSTVASAQYNNYDYNPRGGGVDRSITGQYSKNKKQREVTKVDVVEESMKRLNKDITLDGFQDAVIRDLIKENAEKENKVVEEDIPMESKTEKIIVLREKLNDKIKEILNPEQKEKFEQLGKKKKK